MLPTGFKPGPASKAGAGKKAAEVPSYDVWVYAPDPSPADLKKSRVGTSCLYHERPWVQKERQTRREERGI